MRVDPWDPADGPVSEAALRSKMESLGYGVSRYVYPPGTRFEWHTHGVAKIDAVVSGRFRISFRGGETILEAGDLVWVPEGAEHAAEVVGSEPVVSLDGVKRG